MDFYGLTRPLCINNYSNIMDGVRKANDYFKENFIEVNSNRYIDNTYIFVKYEFVSGMYERLLHCISMEDKEYYTMYPCNNDKSYVNCSTRCQVDKSPEIFKELNRALCLYRLARVKWIPEIIKYANEENPNIKIWRKKIKDKYDKWHWKRYVRYEKGLVDYVLIFNELFKDRKLHLLDFRTAYPVFVKKDKIQFDKDYHEYKNMQKIKIPAFP